MPASSKLVVAPIGLTVLNPELPPNEASVDIVFVHGLGGDAQGTWTYKGPKRDIVSHESHDQVTNRSNQNDHSPVGEVPDANATNLSRVHSNEPGDAVGQSAPQTQETLENQEDRTRRSRFKHLKTAIPRLFSPSSRSRSKTKVQGQSQNATIERDAATERKYSHKQGAKKTAAKDNTFFWAQKLPETCAHARVMTFGYDSDVSKFFGGAVNQNTFYDHAADLLGALVRKRMDTQDRPIIFVAHSLGGLIVKQMLFEADRAEALPQRRKVYLSTRALFFLGTPHRGSDWTGWGEIARGLAGVVFDTNPSLIKHLKVNGEPLMQLEKNFGLLVYRRTFSIYTFTEAKGFKPLPLLNSKIVNENYATVGDQGREQIFTINANHTDMCRFWGKEDPKYEIVAGELQSFVYQSIVQMEVNANQIGKIEETTRHEGQSDQNDPIHSLYGASLTLQSAALLERLEYEGRRNREDQLWTIGANPQTVEWIWDSSFAAWTSEGGALFWIRGKPASGKSTLMEYIAKGDKLQDHLRRGLDDKWTVIRHFFFDFGVSKDKRNNFEGFLRSLLYQLIDRLRGTGEESLPMIEPKQSWSVRSLQERLTSMLKQRSGPVCILLDGLDEYQDSKWDLACMLRELASSRVRFCVASRPDPVFDSTFEDVPRINMQDWNTSAIDKMVTLTIQKSVAGSGFYNDNGVVELAKRISEKAQGVFLWARFAINELRDGWSEGLDLVELEKRLESVPEELEDIYARILRRIKLEQRQQAAYMFQLVCYAQETLTVSELYIAITLATGSRGPPMQHISAHDIQQFKRRILTATGGMLEVFQGSREQEEEADELLVNIIHRTVRTYLDSNGWSQVLGAAHNGLLHAQVLWLRVCAGIFPPSFKSLPPVMGNELMQKRICADPKPPSPSSSRAELSPTKPLDLHQHPSVADKVSPLLEYAALFMLPHAREVEQVLGLPSYNILQAGMSDSFVCYHRYYWALRDGVCACFSHCPEPLHPLHLAIAHGLDGFVRDFLSVFFENTTQGSREWDNVFHLEVNRSLTFGSLNNDRGTFQMSLLEFAIRHASKQYGNGASQTRIVATLLEKYSHAQDVDMIFALQQSSAEVVRLLLAYWPDGKMIFKSDILNSDEDFNEQVLRCGLSEYFQEGFDIGPMWYIARRKYTSFKKDNAEVVDLFIRRGEDVNAQCGPVGTALHGSLLQLSKLGSDPNMWKILLANGADVNASGPFGTPLEFVWRMANTVKMSKYKHVRRWPHAIQWLIENGAVNNRCDPNGSVPSREQMLAFGTSGMDAYRESQRLYRGDQAHHETSMDHRDTNH